MVGIRLRNSMTRKVERLEPIDPQNVRMYVCGPTVYERAHLGNARPAVVFDVLFRLLRHEYGADHVTYVRNFTDVDDKINARAAETGRPISEITDETIAWYLEDMGALGVLEPTHMPRATAYIGAMIAMIEDLVAGGHAYEAEGHVLFSVSSYRNYGRLSGRSVEDMIAGARVEVAPWKRDPMDFVLWKPSDDSLPGWDSPWGRGRPGWHIECSAMAHELLGASFDIHGGGNDLLFPHHENEIAQSACAHPEGHFAKIWMHNEMLQVEGRKMSKSLGNFFTVRELLEQGIPGEVIRFVFLSTHYSKPMDWTAKKAEEAKATLRRWAQLLSERPAARTASEPELDPIVVRALSDDLNAHLALARCNELYIQAKEATNEGNRALGSLYWCMKELLGIDLDDVWEALRPRTVDDMIRKFELGVAYNKSVFGQTIEALIARRILAKRDRDYAESDRIRDALADAGVLLRDVPGGTDFEFTPDFDPAKLENIL
ncbi:cysteine--tRNA ligase [Roseicyclus sp.]|uniref:cysteine--tRNA ligase n=1 Tax=Roseicyclus sp. TaxID=1914329 RepID=UPI003F9F971F